MRKILFLLPILALMISLGLVSAHAQSEPIPKWIKNLALLWAEDEITDDDFITALEFLINQNIIKVDAQDVVDNQPVGILPKETTNEQQSQLETCIELELYSLSLVRDMIDYTNSQNLPPNSYDVLYPAHLIDDLSSTVQQSALHDCLDLIVPIYLDSQVKQDGKSLIDYTLDQIDQYGYDKPDSCDYDPRCVQSILALSNLGKNSVKDDIILLAVFLELDILIS